MPRCSSPKSLQGPTARARRPVIQTDPLRISTRGPRRSASGDRLRAYEEGRRCRHRVRLRAFGNDLPVAAQGAQSTTGPRRAVACGPLRARTANGHRCPITEVIGGNPRASPRGDPLLRSAKGRCYSGIRAAAGLSGRRASHARGRDLLGDDRGGVIALEAQPSDVSALVVVPSIFIAPRMLGAAPEGHHQGGQRVVSMRVVVGDH